MKISTINQIVESILKLAPADTNGDYRDIEMVANEAAIYLKTALICEEKGIDKATEYFMSTHNPDEYQEFVKGVK